MKHFILWFTLILLVSCQKKVTQTFLVFDQGDKALVFAADKLQDVLAAREIAVAKKPELGAESAFQIVLTTIDKCETALLNELNIAESIDSEGFSIRKIQKNGATHFYVVGADKGGAMYGGLELAELIQINGIEGIENIDQKPHMKMRGIKFNIPLDVRTPSYTDMSDVAQQNIAEMWSFDFWKECIDNLALHRYNFISLWSLHPFPSMVKVPEYPEIALDDVQRSTGQFMENYSLMGNGFDAPEVMTHIETLKELTIDQKIAFWKKVMQYAKERNVDFYVVTWNIFNYGTKNQYGITDKFDNPITVDYFRKSVKEMFLTYPDLAGMGFTPGENMHSMTTDEKEKWVFDTYGKGMLDAAKELPGRKMTLLHRQHQTETKKVATQFQPIVDHPDINFLFSFKYAKAHVHSYTKQPYHQEFVKDISKGDLKTIWTLRNDDTFYYRWGAPDFVREFIQNIPLEVSEGWYLGSDQWIWGREFLSNNPRSPREIEISKHWYHWMLWGRLGYDPQISNERFQKILQARYTEVDAKKLLYAWQEASMVYPKTTAFHWGMFDFQWYIEGAKGRPNFTNTETGFHDVNSFIDLPPLESTNYLSIPSYVNKVLNEMETDSITPLELADQIHEHSKKAQSILSELPTVQNDDLKRTLTDIRIMSIMGRYYAYKIEGATQLELFRQTNEEKYQKNAVDRLNKAAEQWRQYASLALVAYKNPLWTNRVGHVNWRELMSDVLKDITIAGGAPQLDSVEETKDGTVLKPNASDDQQELTWTFDAPEAGSYFAEIRYAYEKGIHESGLSINNVPHKFTFWTTGGTNTLGADRVRIQLNKGENHITLTLPIAAEISIEYLKIIHD